MPFMQNLAALTTATETVEKMPTLQLVLGIVLAVISLVLVVAVLLQPGKDKRLSGSIAGGTDTYFGKTKGHSRDKILARLTTVVAILFGALVVTLYVLIARQ